MLQVLTSKMIYYISIFWCFALRNVGIFIWPIVATKIECCISSTDMFYTTSKYIVYELPIIRLYSTLHVKVNSPCLTRLSSFKYAFLTTFMYKSFISIPTLFECKVVSSTHSTAKVTYSQIDLSIQFSAQ